MMRTNVTFRHPAEFIPISDEDGILAIAGSQWLIPILQQTSNLQIEDQLIQEDWGVVINVDRHQKKFWIGISAWPESENAWLLHFHHRSLLQRFSSAAKHELYQLLNDIDSILKNDSSVSEIVWYEESQMSRPHPQGFPTPNEG